MHHSFREGPSVLPSALRTVARGACISLAILVISNKASAEDFMEKRECTLQAPGRAPVHTRCIVNGGISNGSIDVKVTTPDSASHALFGYLDKRDGGQLDRKAARQTSQTPGEFPICIKSLDGKLELCLDHKVE